MRPFATAIPGPRSWALVSALLLLSPGTAPGQSGGKVCVDPEDAEKCFPTIQEGVDAAQPGQTVEVAKGNYEENVVIDQAALILRGSKAEKTIIRAPAGANGITVDAEDVTIRDITVRGASGATGIQLTTGSDGARVTGVIVSNTIKNGTSTGDCIQVFGRRSRVEKSVIRNCGGDGIQVGNSLNRGVLFLRDCFQNGDAGARQNEIVKNEILGCGEDCLQVCGDEALIEDNVIGRAGVTEAFAGPNPSPPPNNIFRGRGHCIDAVGQRLIISGNELALCTFQGIRANGDRAVIDGNEISGAGSHGISLICPQQVPPPSPQCEVGEIVDNQLENVQGDGIRVSGSARAAPFGVQIEKNFLSGIGNNGVRLIGDNYTARKNRVSEVGSRFADTPNNSLEFSQTSVLEGHCFLVEGDDNRLEDNSAETCFQSGYRINGDGNSVIGNQATEVGTSGFDVGNDTASAQGTAVGNVLEGNKAKKNGIYGFRISGATINQTFFGAVDTTLTDNKGKKNGRADLCDAGQSSDVGGGNKFETVGLGRTGFGNCLAF